MKSGSSPARAHPTSSSIEEVGVYSPRWPEGIDLLAHMWMDARQRGPDLPAAPAQGSERDLRALLDLGVARSPRVYLGSEFCEHRIPSPASFDRVVDQSRRAGLPITLLTPPVSDPSFVRIQRLLDRLERKAPGSEVVASDWGVLSELAGRMELQPVLGRLMNRFLRDPRVAPRYLRPDAPAAALQALRDCSLSIPSFASLLRQHRVARVELDWLFQGFGVDFSAARLDVSVYIPFGYVTTGRICPFAPSPRNRSATFVVRRACGAPCRDVAAHLMDPHAERDGGLHRYLQRGNTVFYRHPGNMVSEAIAWCARNRARLVLQTELPS